MCSIRSFVVISTEQKSHYDKAITFIAVFSIKRRFAEAGFVYASAVITAAMSTAFSFVDAFLAAELEQESDYKEQDEKL